MNHEIDLLSDPLDSDEQRQKMNLSYFITCSVCGNKEVMAYYDDKYKGYLAECDICEDMWRIT